MTATLARVDPDELIDVQIHLEAAYNIMFTDDEARAIKTFGQLCAAVSAKITATDVADCTSQQAFYKLRQGLIDILPVDRRTIQPATTLASLFPPEGRRAAISNLEKSLGLPLSILAPHPTLSVASLLMLMASSILLFVNPLYGILGIVVSFTALRLSVLVGRQFTVQTVGDLVRKMVREQYRAVRRNPATVNRQELVDVISQLFYAKLALDPGVLTPDSSFN